MKRIALLLVLVLMFVYSCGDDRNVNPGEPELVGVIKPVISGNEIVFKGVGVVHISNLPDELRLNHTAFDGCGSDHWIYDNVDNEWDKFTSRGGDVCTDALQPMSHLFAARGFIPARYVSDNAEVRIRFDTPEKVEDILVPADYSLEVLVIESE